MQRNELVEALNNEVDKEIEGISRAELIAAVDKLSDATIARFDRADVQAVSLLLCGLAMGSTERSQALGAFTRAIKALDPTPVEALLARARVRIPRGQFDRAAEDLTRAAQLYPEDDNIKLLLGEIEARREKFASATYWLSSGLEGVPDDGQARLLLAVCHQRVGQYDAANDSLAEILSDTADEATAQGGGGEAVATFSNRLGRVDIDKAGTLLRCLMAESFLEIDEPDLALASLGETSGAGYSGLRSGYSDRHMERLRVRALKQRDGELGVRPVRGKEVETVELADHEELLAAIKTLLESPDALPWHQWVRAHDPSLRQLLSRMGYLKLKHGRYEGAARVLRSHDVSFTWCTEARERAKFAWYTEDKLDDNGRPDPERTGVRAFAPYWKPTATEDETLDELGQVLEFTSEADIMELLHTMLWHAEMLQEQPDRHHEGRWMLKAVLRYTDGRYPMDLYDSWTKEARSLLRKLR